MRSAPLPRRLHAGAWWLWALGLMAAATRTTNPLLLALLCAAVVWVVIARRTDNTIGGGFRIYLMVAMVVIAFRVIMRSLFGAPFGIHEIVTLPEVTLPTWATGVTIGGPVTIESILAALYDGFRLATILICVGAANTLADPRRLIKSLPRPLYAAGTSVVIALAVAPQIVDSVRRVRRARLLRGQPDRGWRSGRSIVAPVLEDALAGAIGLAGAMDARGFGQMDPIRSGRSVGWSIAGLALASGGVFTLMISPDPRVPAAILVIGLAAAAIGLRRAATAVIRTVYRPDPWRLPEWLVAGSGLVAGAAMWVQAAIDPSVLAPALEPLSWPSLPLIPLLGIAMAATASAAAPPAIASPTTVTEAVT